MKQKPVFRAAAVVIAIIAIAVAVGWLSGWFPDASPEINRSVVMGWVDEAGVWGPLVVIALMILAVVASPIPSAPIALAAGAAYGHYAGTVYVAIGSELGAMIAFLVARHLGRNAVVKVLGSKADHGLLGSQNALTVIVFSSRLLPFISFDAMSYAAGLSSLQLWRFLLATFAGIIPASFVLAHFGSEAMSGDFGAAEWVTLGLGLLTATPLLIMALKRNASVRRQGSRD